MGYHLSKETKYEVAREKFRKINSLKEKETRWYCLGKKRFMSLKKKNEKEVG